MKAFAFLTFLLADNVHWNTARKCHICLGEYLVHIHSYCNGIWKLHHTCQKCKDVEESFHNTEGLIEFIQHSTKGLSP